jgi:hypothetical protein
VLTPPVLSPGGRTVFVATGSTDLGATNGSIYALSTADGSVLGTIGSGPGGISGTLALSPRYGYLYGGTSGGFLSALPSGGGNPVWAAGGFASSENVNAPAIGADGAVYAATGPTLVAAAGATGATKGRFTAPIATGSLSSPSIGPNGKSTSRPRRWRAARISCSRSRAPAEPLEHRPGVASGREHRITHPFDHALACDERQPPVEPHPARIEGGKPQLAREHELGVVEQRIRHPLPLDEGELLLDGLSRQAMHRGPEL